MPGVLLVVARGRLSERLGYLSLFLECV
jgi:hypothetical protein